MLINNFLFPEHQVQLTWDRISKKHIANLNMMETLPPDHENLKKIDFARMQRLSFLDQALFKNDISVSTYSFLNETEARNTRHEEEKEVYNVLNDKTFFFREIEYMFSRIDPDKRKDCYENIAKILINYK